MKQPRITFLGENGIEELAWEDAPSAPATELQDYFKTVRISPKAINQVSQIVPAEHWKKDGLHSWIQVRANHVFSKLAASTTKGKLRSLAYTFSFDADGPVLESVHLTA